MRHPVHFAREQAYEGKYVIQTEEPKAARLDLSATEALRALRSVRVVDIDLGNGTTKRSVIRGTQRAASCSAPSPSQTSIPRTRHNQARPM
jgi:hypothetical protein